MLSETVTLPPAVVYKTPVHTGWTRGFEQERVERTKGRGGVAGAWNIQRFDPVSSHEIRLSMPGLQSDQTRQRQDVFETTFASSTVCIVHRAKCRVDVYAIFTSTNTYDKQPYHSRLQAYPKNKSRQRKSNVHQAPPHRYHLQS